MRYGFIIDQRRCIGCHACTVACKAEHQTPLGVNRTWVKYIEKGEFPSTRRHFTVLRCNHCEDAPCVDICPVTALFHREDGIVDFDNRRCIGCKACTQACPYDALHIDPATHTAAKCNYCAHRVDIGLEPACVNVCPEQAIISGDLDHSNSAISRLLARQPVSVRKPEKGTQPRLFYIDGEGTALQPQGTLPNPEYLWSSQSGGVGHHAGSSEERPFQAGASRLPTLLSNAVLGTAGREKEDDRTGRTSSVQSRRVYDAPSKGILWGWEVSAYLWTKSLAAGAFLIPFLAAAGSGPAVSAQVQQSGVMLALFFLGLTGVLLIKDLDRPERFLYVLLRPQWKSWLTRGSYIIAGYGALLTAWMVLNFLQFEKLLQWVQGVGILLALLTAVYSAFLLGQARGRDFWQSPILGFHLLAHAFLAGAALFSLPALIWDLAEPWEQWVRMVLRWSILFHLISLAAELGMKHETEEAELVSRDIVQGRFRMLFWAAVVLGGSLLPLLCTLPEARPWLGLAGLLALGGIYVAEHIWVRAPQLVPLS